MAPAEAELAGRIVARRTPLRGAGPDDAADPYRNAGRAYGPRHAPFRSVDELRLVIGMSDALQQALAPVLTVYARCSDVDCQVATAEVLAALAEMGDGSRQAKLPRASTGRPPACRAQKCRSRWLRG